MCKFCIKFVFCHEKWPQFQTIPNVFIIWKIIIFYYKLQLFVHHEHYNSFTCDKQLLKCLGFETCFWFLKKIANLISKIVSEWLIGCYHLYFFNIKPKNSLQNCLNMMHCLFIFKSPQIIFKNCNWIKWIFNLNTLTFIWVI